MLPAEAFELTTDSKGNESSWFREASLGRIQRFCSADDGLALFLSQGQKSLPQEGLNKGSIMTDEEAPFE